MRYGTDEKVRLAAVGVARAREEGCSFLHEAPNVHCPRRKKGQTTTGDGVSCGVRCCTECTYSLVDDDGRTWLVESKGRWTGSVRLERSPRRA
jgi:hypothetical protein